ncbi:hypothetical protein QAD02_008846 [Eretmocerus hayati]|uniref:Uncharacterized protein n=1 Tax=Eretmocerus hayati TaxID=131215 RepID=A0ACC2N811_9HYME|nr:hypothetical protein QAD02_008846 [Eretmocerus hayati]
MWWVYLLVLVISVRRAHGESNATRQIFSPWEWRISNSRSDDITKCPYQVAIEDKNTYLGGGAIISFHYVVTSAECVKHATLDNLYVRAATNFSHFQGSIRKINKIIIHKNFNYTRYDTPINNIALLRTSWTFTFDKLRQRITWLPPLISKTRIKPGDIAVLSGFSQLNDSSEIFRFSSVEVPIVDKIVCNSIYSMSKAGGIGDDQMCAGYYGFYRTGRFCYGEAGSPLAVRGYLIGLLSWAL